MKYLLFFTALIATATAQDRICQCSAPLFGPACAGDPSTCTIPGGAGQCYSTQVQIATVKDTPINVESKGCQGEKDPNVCNEGDVFISTDNVFYLLNNVKCCKDRDQCNNEVPAPPDVSKVNKPLSSKKLVCPSCFVLDKKTCDTKQMNCSEGQDKCFTIIGTIKKGEAAAQDFAAKGCAPPSVFLNNGTTLTKGTDIYKFVDVQLVDAKSGVSPISSCLSFAILLPSVLWFLLDSSLY